MLNNLIEDIALYLFNYISEKQLLDSIKLINKQYYKFVMIYFTRKYCNINYLEGVYPTIFAEQSYSITKINQIRELSNTNNVNNLIVYRSQMGTGKTAVGLYLALKSKRQTLIIVTPKTLSTWFNEIKKFGIYHKNVDESVVLFIHSTINQEHAKYGKNNIINHKIIITSSSVRTLINKNIKNEYNIIIDEAHLFTRLNMLYDKNLKEIILMSASPVNHTHQINLILCENSNGGNTGCYGVTSKNFHINEELIKNRINTSNIGGQYADLIFKYISIKNNNDNSKYEDCDTLNDVIYNNILNKLNKNYEKIVIFMDLKIEILRSYVTSINKIMGEYYIYVFSNTAKTHMNIFDKKKCIILCNYLTAIEGVSFSKGECLILYHFHRNTTEKARQCVGRIRRKNNNNSTIDVFFIINDEDKDYYIKTRLNQIFSLNSNIKWMDRKTNDKINEIIINLNKKNYDLKKLTDTEIIMMFSNGKYNFNINEINMKMQDFLINCYL